MEDFKIHLIRSHRIAMMNAIGFRWSGKQQNFQIATLSLENRMAFELTAPSVEQAPLNMMNESRVVNSMQ